MANKTIEERVALFGDVQNTAVDAVTETTTRHAEAQAAVTRARKQAHDVRRDQVAALDHALNVGVPAALLSEMVGVSPARIYQLRALWREGNL